MHMRESWPAPHTRPTSETGAQRVQRMQAHSWPTAHMTPTDKAGPTPAYCNRNLFISTGTVRNKILTLSDTGTDALDQVLGAFFFFRPNVSVVCLRPRGCGSKTPQCQASSGPVTSLSIAWHRNVSEGQNTHTRTHTFTSPFCLSHSLFFLPSVQAT